MPVEKEEGERERESSSSSHRSLFLLSMAFYLSLSNSLSTEEGEGVHFAECEKGRESKKKRVGVVDWRAAAVEGGRASLRGCAPVPGPPPPSLIGL